MGLRAWLGALRSCCRRCCDTHCDPRCDCDSLCPGPAAPNADAEKEPLVRETNPYTSFGVTVVRDDEKNLWSIPHDVSHTEADDDRILYNLIVIRNQQARDSEKWQKLNYDIYALRQIRREVQNRWKRILEDLGFQKEADSLLSVTYLSTISDSQNTRKAREMLLKLAEETSIFPNSWGLSERYLFVVDRLIALDAAEEFLRLASHAYPRRPCVPPTNGHQKELKHLSVPGP
ncbi:melanoregulin [Ornithorhynchus anatinus]|uniref:Melanoregulin n=1 Tax=Ornithorhynchus anatinus TaxID=9258 RepID=A0A6I8PFY2_ORNAN|nr:melanoregulin [Ornithorhynchus anatinus]